MSAEQVSMREEMSRSGWESIGLVRSGQMDRVVKRHYYDNEARLVLELSAADYTRYTDDIAAYRHWALTYAGWRTVTVTIIDRRT